MKHTLRAAALAVVALASLSAQAPPAAPVKIDGTGGARTQKQTRPPDNRRPRGTAVGLLGWRAGHPLGCIRRHSLSGGGFTDRRGGRRIRRRREHERRLQNERRRDRDAESAPQRSRAARTGVPSQTPSRRIPLLAASYWISPKHSRSKSFSRNSRQISTASKSPSKDESRHVQAGADRSLGADLRDAAKASPLLLELSKQQPPEAPEWPNKCTDCGTSRPTNRAAVLYDRSRRR